MKKDNSQTSNSASLLVGSEAEPPKFKTALAILQEQAKKELNADDKKSADAFQEVKNG